MLGRVRDIPCVVALHVASGMTLPLQRVEALLFRQEASVNANWLVHGDWRARVVEQAFVGVGRVTLGNFPLLQFNVPPGGPFAIILHGQFRPCGQFLVSKQRPVNAQLSPKEQVGNVPVELCPPACRNLVF